MPDTSALVAQLRGLATKCGTSGWEDRLRHALCDAIEEIERLTDTLDRARAHQQTLLKHLHNCMVPKDGDAKFCDCALGDEGSAERDALAAKVARVEALVGFFGRKYDLRFEGERVAEMIRGTLSGEEAPG